MNFKLPKEMNPYIIYWQPQLQSEFSQQCPFVNVIEGVFYTASQEWPNGYFRLEQSLNENQFEQVDEAANQLICIDIKPAPQPPGNPHGR